MTVGDLHSCISLNIDICVYYTVFYIVHVLTYFNMQLTDKSLVVGSALSLNVLIDLLHTHNNSSPTTFSRIADHLSNIANVPVRNVSIINIMDTM